jgi:hypothetical protein
VVRTEMRRAVVVGSYLHQRGGPPTGSRRASRAAAFRRPWSGKCHDVSEWSRKGVRGVGVSPIAVSITNGHQVTSGRAQYGARLRPVLERLRDGRSRSPVSLRRSRSRFTSAPSSARSQPVHKANLDAFLEDVARDPWPAVMAREGRYVGSDPGGMVKERLAAFGVAPRDDDVATTAVPWSRVPPTNDPTPFGVLVCVAACGAQARVRAWGRRRAPRCFFERSASETRSAERSTASTANADGGTHPLFAVRSTEHAVWAFASQASSE